MLFRSGIVTPNSGDTGYAAGEWRTNDETGEMQFHAADGTVVSEKEWAGGSTTGESTEA